ncbi:tetratricopeptide repeat-containing sensor histidine kinase [uncultured Draconibacterium sp.]|uniref:tetratricopeptide repeat-containing sensor histidine kinase n=1 Tax=uncultured Draconibacterium sp. TaxID=1573823 RepID=UPI0025F07662|nr:tetratricopeptide repeat-containing sensor histidine kinase [uncultured Draconibacterium sp.]
MDTLVLRSDKPMVSCEILGKKWFFVSFLLVVFQLAGKPRNLPPQTVKHLATLNDTEKIDYLANLCWTLRGQENENAILYGQYALHLADSLNMQAQVARISNYLGVNMLYFRYDTKQAWHYFRDALDHSIKAQDSIQMGFAHDNMGYLYLIHGDENNAYTHEKIAEELFARLNDEQGLAYIYTNLGLVHQARKEYKDAMDYFLRARAIHLKNNNQSGTAAILYCMGENYILQQQPDSALSYFHEQLTISEKEKNKKYIAQALKGMGEVHYQQQNYTEALSVLNRAMELAMAENDNLLLIGMYTNKALIYAKTGFPQLGEIELQKALELAGRLQLPKEIFNIGQAYTELYASTGFNEYSAATYNQLFERYNQLYDQLQKETIINENQHFETLQALKEMEQAALNDKKLHKSYVVILVLVLLLLLAFIWLSYSTRQLNEQLRQSNSNMVAEVKQKEQALHELEKSEMELKASINTKDKLFSIISHDLRSPFNAILGLSRMLHEEEDKTDKQEQKQITENLLNAAENAYNMLDNLLIWAATQTQRIRFSPGLLSVKSMVNDSISLLLLAAKDKNISVHQQSDTDYQVLADREMLKIILRNLLSNAIKFTPDQGEIWVSWQPVPEKELLSISVQDTGIGISPEAQKQLFKPDGVKSVPGTRNEKGTGLGLQLCKEFVERQGGTLHLESQPGKGSTFSFTLPCSGAENLN